MLDTMSTITPTPIGPFTLRSQPKTLNQLQKTVINAHKNCERELRRLLPLPDDHVTNDPIRRPFSQLKREREKAYAEVSVLEQYKESLNKLLSFISWLRKFNDNPQDPWYQIPIYKIQETTFDEFKTAALFYRDFDSVHLKIGIHFPREKEHQTVAFEELTLENRIRKGIILICLAPFPKSKEYKFRNPNTISEFESQISQRISALKVRLNGERRPVASKVSQRNCSSDEANFRYKKEAIIWENALRARLAALQNLKDWAKELTTLPATPDNVWPNTPVYFVRKSTFQKFVDNGHFFRYFSNPHMMVGLAIPEDTYETRNFLLNQKRSRQCFMPSELTHQKAPYATVLMVCIPPIPKWPILKWN